MGVAGFLIGKTCGIRDIDDVGRRTQRWRTHLNRIHAHHFSGNQQSGKVLQKLGMTLEGKLRQHVKKWGVLEDVFMYGILCSEYSESQASRPEGPVDAGRGSS